ncbi:MAG: DUF1232 domain-containing protein [Bacteroidetes bacterium]|nr:DUF1232 domain-containing protein [Bacteroidota bacterium]
MMAKDQNSANRWEIYGSKAKSFFDGGLSFANKLLASQYIKRLKAFLPKPFKIMFALRNTYEEKGSDASIEAIAEDLFTKTKLLGEFIKAYYNGDYRDVDPIKIFMIFAVLVYIVSPIDLIPDWIAFIGLLDEIILIIWLFENLYEELEKFQAWKESRVEVVV